MGTKGMLSSTAPLAPGTQQREVTPGFSGRDVIHFRTRIKCESHFTILEDYFFQCSQLPFCPHLVHLK